MNLKQNLIIIAAIIFIGLAFIVYSKFNNKEEIKETKSTQQLITEYLTNKYNEEFTKPKFIKQSTVETNKNSYEKEQIVMNYYVANSKNNNSDITIYYQEGNQSFSDTYELEKEELQKSLAFFDLLNTKFSNAINYYTIKENYHQLALSQTKSKEDLEKGLKTIYDCPVNYLNNRVIEFTLKINQNVYSFSKANYNNLLEVLNFLKQNITKEINFEFKIMSLDNVEIKYEAKTQNLLVNDLNSYFSEMARNESLTDFVKRSNYTIKIKKY